ncbi:MAG: DMT family transporter [Chromatiales bacterium]|jgi:drug/metabolite transporter (DMT)-like permease|nr:DMT family transporter [Chromatiales bacterium]
MTPLPQHLTAILWMLGTLLSLCLMSLAARELSVVYDTAQILFIRNLFGLTVILLIMVRTGTGITRTHQPVMQVMRNLVHLVAVSTWFWGITQLPLVEVFVLESTMPIWVTILATLLLGEQLTRSRVTGVILGFIGVLIILRPGLAIVDPAALVVLAGAIAFAGAAVATKTLTRTDAPLTILFWMFVVQLTATTLIAGPTIFVPPADMVPWAIAVGLSGMAAHYCTARSLVLADVGLVTPLHYLRIPLIAWVGWVLYDEAVDVWLFVGALVIFVGTMATIRTARRSPE